MNPKKLKPYQKADEIQKTRENKNAWLMGLYTWKALQSAMSSLGKKSRNIPYPSEPFPITKGEIEEAERKKMERMKRQFATFVEGLVKKKCQTS